MYLQVHKKIPQAQKSKRMRKKVKIYIIIAKKNYLSTTILQIMMRLEISITLNQILFRKYLLIRLMALFKVNLVNTKDQIHKRLQV